MRPRDRENPTAMTPAHSHSIEEMNYNEEAERQGKPHDNDPRVYSFHRGKVLQQLHFIEEAER
jgi:hypothetical protein